MDRFYRIGFLLVLFDIGTVWLRSSIGKISGGKFIGILGGILNSFASKNPNIWYKDFLHSMVIPNSKLFGNLIMWGEFLTAISIIFASLYLLFNKDKNLAQVILFLGLLGGVLLNLNFWLASSWIGPSTDSLNLLMLTIELIGIVLYGKILFKKS